MQEKINMSNDEIVELFICRMSRLQQTERLNLLYTIFGKKGSDVYLSITDRCNIFYKQKNVKDL